MKTTDVPGWWRLALPWLLFYTLLWVLLTGARGWGFALVLVPAASAVSVALGSSLPPLRWHRLPVFIGWYLRALWAGGWDVARRALHPRLPLAPDWVSYTCTCANPRVRLWLSALVGLLPGTFATHYDGEHLYIHVLDHTQPWAALVRQLEAQLAQLLGGTDR
ncbi:Na+/H+ antiporter subunit E [Marinimicrobium alkaliphilum]|uniref:Na+/H+ antiporter subunit E n=1 Tax=Marinimicrobium alkaliphilum TaxID=2202654 RepID=UPI000DB980BC|nr:Na+/H+ antiporter subunit E [Marinimicrobium alkaliphilum]